MSPFPKVHLLARASLLLVALPLGLVLLVLHAGNDRFYLGSRADARPVVAPEEAAAPSPSPGRLLAQILAVLVATRAAGLALRPLRQPQVVGDMLGGILLGPSLLGLLAPTASAALFPPDSLAALSALSQVGMVLYMFLVGMELDTGTLRAHGAAAVLTSHASIAFPFALGVALALVVYERLAPAGIAFTPFALFLGAAMSVTAFPVLARILAERGLLQTSLGALALSAAAVGDVTAWTILLAITVYVRSAGTAGLPWAAAFAGLAAFVAAAFWLRGPIRRGIAAVFARRGGITHGQVAVLVGLALGGAGITEALGVHALFGAFFVGLVLSKEREVARAVKDRLEAPLVVVLLPLYFAFTGLRTRLDLVDPPLFGLAAGIVAVAVAGKLGGSALAARVSGLPPREAAAVGVLMNTRGLMELVILNIGLDLGVLTRELFSIMVLMAFTTTLMTSPLLSALRIDGPRRREGEAPSP